LVAGLWSAGPCDEAAARLAATFADVVGGEIEAHGDRVVEVRGDEALAVFTSARQAIRAGVDDRKGPPGL